MKTTYSIRVGRRGAITLPKALRDQHQITAGESLTVFALSEDVFVLTRRHSQVDAVADELAQVWQDSGENLESMLLTLRAVRTEHQPPQP